MLIELAVCIFTLGRDCKMGLGVLVDSGAAGWPSSG